MSSTISLPILLPLVAAGLQLLFPRFPLVGRIASVAVLAASAVSSLIVLFVVSDGTVLIVHVGGWPAPFGIVLVADALSALMLATAGIILLAVAVGEITLQDDKDRPSITQPAFLVMAAGLALVFQTGDLFNLFVAFEVTMTASYVFLAQASHRSGIPTMATYVTVNLLSASLFLLAVGLLYGTTGTVNLAELATMVRATPGTIRTVIGGLLLVVFGTKAAVFPWSSWLPESYPAVPAPVVAAFAGLLAEVGVYGLLRTQTLLFPEVGVQSLVLLTLGSITILVGVVAALAQREMRRLLSWDLVSQIGFVVWGLGLGTETGVTAAVFFAVHHSLVKAGMFLSVGLLEAAGGGGRITLDEKGFMRRAPWGAISFAVLAASLAGFPPFSGYVGKLALVEAGIGAGRAGYVAVVLVGTFLTVVVMGRVWGSIFLGRTDKSPPEPATGMGGTSWAVVGVTLITLLVAAAAGPLYEIAAHAGNTLADPSGYVEAVLG
jgi:multicomponent Na+:H+ antiporter subunit D